MSTSPRPYYEHGGITLYHGDCREILPSLALPALYSVVTDPPYGTGWILGGGKRAGDFNGETKGAAWDAWDTRWLALLAATPPLSWAIFCPDARVHELGCHFGGVYRLRFYVKSNPRPPLAGNDSPSVEPIVVAPRVRFSSGPSHLVAYNGDAEHPCQKPLTIMRWLVHGTVGEHETVLDPFAGVGSTLRAAKDEGHRAIGIEIEERYCEIAARRLAQETLFSTGSPNGR